MRSVLVLPRRPLQRTPPAQNSSLIAQLCQSMRFASSAKTTPHLDGFLSERVNWPAKLVHVLPDNVSYELGALAEPLSVVVHALRRSRAEAAGSSALVIGAGAVGLLACSLLKASGCSDVSAVDIPAAQPKLDFAREQGLVNRTAMLAPPSPPPDDDPHTLGRARDAAQKLCAELEHVAGFDLVFECSGFGEPLAMAINAARTGGKVMIVGMGTPSVMLPISTAALREVDLIGVFRSVPWTLTRLIRAATATRTRPRWLCSHRGECRVSISSSRIASRSPTRRKRLSS